jgi:hypothetical protein
VSAVDVHRWAQGTPMAHGFQAEQMTNKPDRGKPLPLNKAEPPVKQKAAPPPGDHGQARADVETREAGVTDSDGRDVENPT